MSQKCESHCASAATVGKSGSASKGRRLSWVRACATGVWKSVDALSSALLSILKAHCVASPPFGFVCLPCFLLPTVVVGLRCTNCRTRFEAVTSTPCPSLSLIISHVQHHSSRFGLMLRSQLTPLLLARADTRRIDFVLKIDICLPHFQQALPSLASVLL